MKDDELPPVVGEAFRRAFDNIFRAPDVRADQQEEDEDGRNRQTCEAPSR
jgi:hypothetical protein